MKLSSTRDVRMEIKGSDEKDGARHLLYPDEPIEHKPKPTVVINSPLKIPHSKAEAMVQIKLHQIFIGNETILADEMSVIFHLDKVLPSELITVVTPTAKVPLNLSSLRCSRVQVL